MDLGHSEAALPGQPGAGAAQRADCDGSPPPVASRERPRRRGPKPPRAKGTRTKKRGANMPTRCSKNNFSAGRTPPRPYVADIREPKTTQVLRDPVCSMEAPMLSALLLLTGLLFFVSLLCLYYSSAFSNFRRWLRFTDDYEECKTKFCHGFSSRLPRVRPERPTDLCDDIYTPMCSSVALTYPEARKTAAHHPVWSVTAELTKQRHRALADLLGSPDARENPASNATALIFRSCLANRHHPSLAQEVRRLLSLVGLRSWPLNHRTPFNVVHVLMTQLRDLAAPFVVTLSAAEYAGDPHRPAIHLNEPQLLLSPAAWKPWNLARGLPTPSASKNSEKLPDLGDPEGAYVGYAEAVLSELFAGSNGSSVALRALAKQLALFEVTLSGWLPPRGRRVTFVHSFVRRLHQLGDLRDMELWLHILRGVFKGQHAESVDEEVPVVSFSRNYMAFVHKLLTDRSVALANYMGWRLIEHFAWSGSGKLREERARYLTSAQHEGMELVFSQLSPATQCALEVSRLLPASSGRLYRFAVSVLPHRAMMLLDVTVETLKVAVTLILQESPWVDDETLARAVRRVQEMKTSFGHGKVPPEESFPHGEGLNETNFYKNLLLIARKKAQVQRAVVSGAVPFVPSGVNHMGLTPFYDPIKNTLFVPYGILVEPFFMGATPSVHFSNAGFLIAKEMLQAILGTGQYFHDDGFKNMSWWSTFTQTNYQANKECIHFYIHHNTKFNLTDEEVTDLQWTAAALEVAFKAFRIFLGQYEDMLQKIAALKTLYTQSQLFFFGFVLNRCSLTFAEASPIRKRFKEPGLLQLAMQQMTKFRKSFRCQSYSPCPFWRLEENDFWDARPDDEGPQKTGS